MEKVTIEKYAITVISATIMITVIFLKKLTHQIKDHLTENPLEVLLEVLLVLLEVLLEILQEIRMVKLTHQIKGHLTENPQEVLLIVPLEVLQEIQMVTNLWRCVSTLKSLTSQVQEVTIQSYFYTMPISTPELH